MHPFLEGRKGDFQASIDHFKKELSTLRTGVATPALVEDIKVSAYDSLMDIKGVASIKVMDPKTMNVEPWDKSLLQTIEKAIRDADIGISPSVDGEVVRINIPPMTEENRKQIVKKVKEKMEDARVSVRSTRETLRDEVNRMEKEKEISEDEKFKILDEIDKATKEFTQEIDEIATTKEEEIMTV
jgi:ribosome recycling factor